MVENHLPPEVADAQFLMAVYAEIKRARIKYPGPDAANAAMVEEVGEVSKALMYEPWGNVVAECIQVAATAMRIAIDGDPTMDAFRWEHVHANGTKHMEPEDLGPVPRQSWTR